MLYARIAFCSEVPTPKSASFARSNWVASFDREEFLIQREGDTVHITHRDSGRAYAYPWERVAACEIERAAPAPSRKGASK